MSLKLVEYKNIYYGSYVFVKVSFEIWLKLTDIPLTEKSQINNLEHNFQKLHIMLTNLKTTFNI